MLSAPCASRAGTTNIAERAARAPRKSHAQRRTCSSTSLSRFTRGRNYTGGKGAGYPENLREEHMNKRKRLLPATALEYQGRIFRQAQLREVALDLWIWNPFTSALIPRPAGAQMQPIHIRMRKPLARAYVLQCIPHMQFGGAQPCSGLKKDLRSKSAF